MTCDSTRTHLDAYLDAEVSETVAGEIRAHLTGCPGCKAEHDLAVQIQATLSETETVRAPESVVTAALAAARVPAARRATARSPIPPRRTRRRWVWASAPLLLAAFALSLWALLARPEPTSTPPALADVAETAPEEESRPAPLVAPPSEVAEVVPEPPAPARDRPSFYRDAPRTPPPVRRQRRPPPRPDPAPQESPLSTEVAQAASPDVETDPTPDEIEQAQEDLQLALSLIADAQRRAGESVRQEAAPISEALDYTIPF